MEEREHIYLYFNEIGKGYLVVGEKGLRDWFWNDFYKDDLKIIEYIEQKGSWNFNGYTYYLFQLLKDKEGIELIEISEENIEELSKYIKSSKGSCCDEEKKIE